MVQFNYFFVVKWTEIGVSNTKDKVASRLKEYGVQAPYILSKLSLGVGLKLCSVVICRRSKIEIILDANRV